VIRIVSFGYKKGVPKKVDHVIDCRGLRNPHFVPHLQGLTGLDKAVQDYVLADPKAKEIIKRALSVSGDNATLAFGCFGGRHRSVTIAEKVAEQLRNFGKTVVVIHRELRQR